jgi:ferredoxin
MPSLLFLPLQKKTSSDTPRKLLGLIVSAGLPIGRSCEGEGFCGACRVVVYQDGLDPLSPLEAATLLRINAMPQERLACCARLINDASIGCAAWGVLP